MRMIVVFLIAMVPVACQEPKIATVPTVLQECEAVPRTANTQLLLSPASDNWFQVYETNPNTYAITEPYHYQETISHLIVGEERALLFDTGSGFMPIRPVVERITSLPVTVLNSHTHYDHVGGNSEFPSILAIDTDYTRANMSGFQHERLSADLGPDAFCKGIPEGFAPTTFATKPWKASRYVLDGEILDLGGRSVQVLLVPGHTPDATALLDSESGLLFTGDSFYDATIWLFVPETSLSDYGHSMDRLAKVESNVKYLLGAHNVARVDAGALTMARSAFEQLISHKVDPTEVDGERIVFNIDGVRFLTAESILQGKQGDLSKGGSGLDTWR